MKNLKRNVIGQVVLEEEDIPLAIYRPRSLLLFINSIPTMFGTGRRDIEFLNSLYFNAIKWSGDKEWMAKIVEEIDKELSDEYNADYFNLLLQRLKDNLSTFKTESEELKDSYEFINALTGSVDLSEKIFNYDQFVDQLNEELEESDNDENKIEQLIFAEINQIKRDYGVKDIVYSNEISPENLYFILKEIQSLGETISAAYLDEDEEASIFSINSHKRDIGLSNKVIAIDISQISRFDNENNTFYISLKERDAFLTSYISFMAKSFILFKQNVNYSEAQKFFRFFLVQEKAIEDPKAYARNFLHYLEDFNNFTYKRLPKNYLQVQQLNSLFNSIIEILADQDFGISTEKNLSYFNNWYDRAIENLSEFNFARNLKQDFQFKSMVATVILAFKHISRGRYVLSYWRDMFLIETFVKAIEEKNLDLKEIVDEINGIMEGLIKDRAVYDTKGNANNIENLTFAKIMREFETNISVGSFLMTLRVLINKNRNGQFADTLATPQIEMLNNEVEQIMIFALDEKMYNTFKYVAIYNN